jgi:hypothetical protein
MGISPGGVHDEATLILTDSLGKGFGTLFNDDVSPSSSARHRRINCLARIVDNLRNDDVALEFRLPDLSLNLTAVDSKISEVGEKFLGTVGAADECEKFRSTDC